MTARHRAVRLALPMALLFAVGCENRGVDRLLSLDATGVVRGSVYFDANGSRTFDAGDHPFPGAGVRILAPISRDTLWRGVSGADGSFSFAGVPVGSYVIVVDGASVGDSVVVVSGASGQIAVAPDDTVTFESAVSYPFATLAEARAAAPGTHVFVTGIALHSRATFSDTTLHIVDESDALRATRVRPSSVPVSAGDSVRLRGRVAERLGQRVLDDVSVFVVGPTFIPTAATVTTAAAASADGATRDAELVRILDAEIVDTVTVLGHLEVTVDDGSGPVVMMLDRAADVAFRPPFPPAEYDAGNRFDLTGVLVPNGDGTWRIKPRSVLDLVRR